MEPESSAMNSEQGRLFVGGLTRLTTVKTLTDYFSKYGRVKDAVVIFDKATKTSKGYGFVHFTGDPSIPQPETIFTDEHIIDGKKVDVKAARPRNKTREQNGETSPKYHAKKIFVGGLTNEMTEDELKAFFKAFGNVTDVVVIHNKVNGKPRGFGFVSFDSEESVNSVLQQNFYNLNGHKVEAKRAKVKEQNYTCMRNYNGYSIGMDYNCPYHTAYASIWNSYLVNPSLYWYQYGPMNPFFGGWYTYSDVESIWGGKNMLNGNNNSSASTENGGAGASAETQAAAGLEVRQQEVDDQSKPSSLLDS